MLSLSSCRIDQFTCNDGNCVNMDKRFSYLKFTTDATCIGFRCDGELHCTDGSDEQQCRLVVPSVGYNKFLTPPPLKGQQYLYINVSYDFRNILYIDEEENFIRITLNVQKDWYNSFLTFQNLKRDSVNLIFEDDKNMIWTPWIVCKNLENKDKEVRADSEEIFKVVPNEDFYYMHNSINYFQNSLLFKE